MGHRDRTNTSELNPAPHRHEGAPQLASRARKKKGTSSSSREVNPTLPGPGEGAASSSPEVPPPCGPHVLKRSVRAPPVGERWPNARRAQGLASGSGGTEPTPEESGVSLGFGRNRAKAQRVFELLINAHGSLLYAAFSVEQRSQPDPSRAVRVGTAGLERVKQ